MIKQFLFGVKALGSANFLEALGAAGGTLTPPFNATPMYNIPGVLPIGSRRYIIQAIEVKSVQNVGMEYNFFSSASGAGATVDADTFISRWAFTKAMGEQIGNPATGFFRYFISGLEIPYEDADTKNTVNPPTLHVIMQNVDTVAKSQGAAGAISTTFWMQMQQSW